ncbi:MAG: hypothetical protein AAB403_04600 [Planctomycetota bacterium]
MTGLMERVENQKQVFHPFHSPLEISQEARDSHIPTAPTTVPLYKGEKEKNKTDLILPVDADRQNQDQNSSRSETVSGDVRSDFMIILGLEYAEFVARFRRSY